MVKARDVVVDLKAEFGPSQSAAVVNGDFFFSFFFLPWLQGRETNERCLGGVLEARSSARNNFFFFKFH